MPIYVKWPENGNPESELMFGWDGSGEEISCKQIQGSQSGLKKNFKYRLW